MVDKDPYRVERAISKEIHMVTNQNDEIKTVYMAKKKKLDKLNGRSIEEWKTVS